MLRPSYAELMDVLNKEGEGNNVKSRYTIVIATAKRARQLIDGDDPMIENIKVDKPVTIAVEELRQGKIEIVPEGQGTVLNLKGKKADEDEPKEEKKVIDMSADDDDDEFSDTDDETETLSDEEISEFIDQQFNDIVAAEDNGDE